MQTLGIDLASRARNTAACVVEWRQGTARVADLRAGLSNDELLPLMHSAAVVGLDAPFGWPDAFADAVRHWGGSGRWPLAWDEKAGSEALRLRATDQWVWKTIGKQPLSVSSDRIGITAWRAAALLTAFGGTAVDRVHGRVREVYPGAALIAWDLLGPRPPSSYKRDPAVRESMLDKMAAKGGWLDLDRHRDQMVTSDHAFDALISALVARAADGALAWAPPDDIPRERLQREGWIWLPRPDSWPRLAQES